MFEKAVSLSPNSEVLIGNLADGYRWNGQAAQAGASYDKAIALALKDLQVNPRNAVARGNLALYQAKKGDRASARQMIDAARGVDRANVNLMYLEATIDVLGGQIDEAFTALEEALKAGYPFAAAEGDPDLRPLRTDERFKALAAKYRPAARVG
jgi:tetratricopeptide (TPR) repeat protein